MNTWQPHLALEAQLKKLDEQRVAAPNDNALLFDRANVLGQMGRYEEAQAAYFELLKKEPTHFGTLNNLGVQFAATGYLSAACTAYAEAVKHHPTNVMGQVNLANTYVKMGEPALARQHFVAALAIDPDNHLAHQGYAFFLTTQGKTEAAREHQVKGFKQQPISVFPYCGKDIPYVVLLLASANGGDVPMLHHLDDTVFYVSVLYVEFYDATLPFPPHQLVINVIGDADLSQPALIAAQTILARTNAPVINAPAAVMPTGRASNALRLSGLTGVVAPHVRELPRAILAGEDAAQMLIKEGFSFPLLIRSPGFHTGFYFKRVEVAQDFAAAVHELPGDELLVIQYLDARGVDGKFRKYRVIMIDGKFYPLHVAVSNNWKVHYFTADMAENVQHRAEDEAFLKDMAAVIGPRAMQALQAINDMLGLEYAGIDFGVNAEGELIFFEANATMVVNPVDHDPRWDYRRAPVQQILEAIRQMLLRRMTTGVLAKIAAA